MTNGNLFKLIFGFCLNLMLWIITACFACYIGSYKGFLILFLGSSIVISIFRHLEKIKLYE